MSAVVGCVLIGHPYKIEIPKATCSIAFSLLGVRCPSGEEPLLSCDIIMQRDVEVALLSFFLLVGFFFFFFESHCPLLYRLK